MAGVDPVEAPLIRHGHQIYLHDLRHIVFVGLDIGRNVLSGRSTESFHQTNLVGRAVQNSRTFGNDKRFDIEECVHEPFARRSPT